MFEKIKDLVKREFFTTELTKNTEVKAVTETFDTLIVTLFEIGSTKINIIQFRNIYIF